MWQRGIASYTFHLWSNDMEERAVGTSPLLQAEYTKRIKNAASLNPIIPFIGMMGFFTPCSRLAQRYPPTICSIISLKGDAQW